MENCYKGLFWNIETKTFQRWKEYVEYSSGSTRNREDNLPPGKD
jgi:hypothetical protein